MAQSEHHREPQHKMTGKSPSTGNRAAVSALSPWQWLGLQRPVTIRFVLLLLVVMGSGLSVVYITHRDRVLFNELQQLKGTANALQLEWGQLLIEQSTFGLEGRIENKAVEQLGMRVPPVDHIVMVKP